MKILVVDDERIILTGIVRMLKAKGGNEGLCAGDGFSALEMLRGVRADVVVTDILMPEMDGLEFIKIAKRENLCDHFIILSGYAEFVYARQAISYGVAEYLLKPVDQKELYAALEKIQRGEEGKAEREWELSSPEELEERIMERKLDAKDVKMLAREIWKLPDEWAPESGRIRILLYLVLLYPMAGREMEEALEKKEKLPREAAAVRLYGALRVYVEEKNHPPSATAALIFLMKEYTCPELCLTYAAQQLYMNANYLSGLVGRAVGISFHSFVRLLRISKAQQLLRAPEELSIQKVSDLSGFGNMNLFFRSFRDITGTTPMNYRNRGK